jgi:hypothetical protein
MSDAMKTTLGFHGAAGTVTGSRLLVERDARRVLDAVTHAYESKDRLPSPSVR